MALANSVAMLLLSRIFIGITIGVTYVVMPIYLAEISSINIRGSVSVLTVVVLKLGILFMYIVGQYFSISQVGWFSSVIPIIFLVSFNRCPESPYYLLAAQDEKGAQKCLAQLRGHSDVQTELEQMRSVIEFRQMNRPTFSELISKQNRQSLMIVMALAMAKQLNSSVAVMAYAEMIFDHIGSDFPAGYSTIILGVLELVATVCGSIFMDNFGRRRIMFMSLVTAIFCNLSVAIYFMLQRWHSFHGWTWFPIAVLMIGNAMAAFGLFTLPTVILGEIFPKHMKGFAANAQVLCGAMCSFLVMKGFQIIVDSLGYDVMFGMFTLACLVLAPFFWYRLPETKGKTFQVILEELHAKSLR